MTAYGRHSGSAGGKEITVEIKSVNNRFLDCSIRLPRNYSYLEEKVKKEISARGISRGKLEVNITVNKTECDTSLSLDKEYAAAYIEALRSLRDEFSLRDDISVMSVARHPEIFVVTTPEVDEDAEWADLLSALSPAIDGFILAREREGANLERDMFAKIENLRSLAKKVAELSEKDIKGYRARLEERLRTVLADNRVTIDENRILTECAIFADKVAIDEELVRLESHFGAFIEFLNAKEPVGRKIDFLLQEMNRETNTIGSKGSDTEIARLVVEMKSELEKIREQIQNIE
jgi:uncharacterized protein (TIGR00255 family)